MAKNVNVPPVVLLLVTVSPAELRLKISTSEPVSVLAWVRENEPSAFMVRVSAEVSAERSRVSVPPPPFTVLLPPSGTNVSEPGPPVRLSSPGPERYFSNVVSTLSPSQPPPGHPSPDTAPPPATMVTALVRPE